MLCQKGTDDQLTRVECIDTLCSIFMDKCGCRDMVTTRFQCSQVLANMEELIANSPFGDVKGIGLGHGSLVGKSILDLKSENVDDCLDEILLFIQALPDYDLKVLSLHRFTDGVVRLLANNRVLNRVDAEHMLCKLYIIYERLKGGSRSASVSPRLFFEHCHPIPGITFHKLQTVAKEVLVSFRGMVEEGNWVFYDECVGDPRPN